jgi:phosphatidylserine/phosphatidylglycerophosphate/cardiolipin synthase-like enzyme
MANTDPNHWFLPSSEFPDGRTFTSGNEVTPLIDGAVYMDHLAARIAAMGPQDYFHMTGWRVTAGQFLEPTSSGPPTFFNQLRSLINNHVTVRVMIWLNRLFVFPPNHRTDNNGFVGGIISASNTAGGVGTGILDERLRSGVFSAHHQKTIILSAADTGGGAQVNWAYVGGIDICVDRWDTRLHDSPSPPRTREFMDAWHDVQCAVKGGAVAQVWENFKQRWNDRTLPHASPTSPDGAPPPLITDAPPAGASFSSHHVQVLRTLACNGVYSFLPGGEQTIRKAYEKAIDAAQHYIYIEDQYFWPCSIVDKLQAAADRGVKVILVVTRAYDIPLLKGIHNRMRAEAIATVALNRPQNVFVFHLQKPGLGADIYVHAKLMIVDDCYAAIGSANVGFRSYTTDSELHLAIIDADTVSASIGGLPVTVCRFARELRLALWAEHLGLADPAPVDDPIVGLTVWPDRTVSTPASPDQRHHAVCHFVPSAALTLPVLRRFIIQQASFVPTPFGIPSDLTDAVLEALIPDPEAFIRDRFMNIQTLCQ